VGETVTPEPAPSGTAVPGRSGPARQGRLFLLVAAALLLGALGLWGSTRLTWASTEVAVTGHGAGTLPIEADGAQLAPALIGVAVLAAAAVAAAIAVSGIARRVLGAIVALAGAAGVWVALHAWAVPPSPDDLPRLTGTAAAGAAPVAGATVQISAAPWLGALGGLLVVGGGLLLVVLDRRLPRMGARYDAPGAARNPRGDDRPVDPERAAWDELDAGVDPTTEGTFATAEPDERGPGGRPRTGAD